MAGVYADLFAEPFYAKEAGTFERAGFDVDVAVMTNAGAITAAVVGGTLDVGMADLLVGANAFSAGIPIDLIAGGCLNRQSDDTVCIGVLKDSPITGPKDLAGKTLGLPSIGGTAGMFARAWIAASGIQVTSVKIVEVPTPLLAGTLQRGAVDAALVTEPFLTPVRDQIRSIGNPFNIIPTDYLITVFYANRGWLAADPARAKRLVAAIYDTARWANTHRADTMTILARNGQLNTDSLKGMGRVTYATSLTLSLVQPVLDLAAQYKFVDKRIDAASLIKL